MPKKNLLSSVDTLSPPSVSGGEMDKPLSSTLVKATQIYDERLMVFNIMGQINFLCRAVQRHRGYSMGLLAGYRTFADEFKQLEQQMSRRIQLITAFAHRSPSLYSHTEVERLYFAWNTIRDNWQQDSVLENFEFHAHFVDQLLIQLMRLAEKIRQPYGRTIHSLITDNKLDSNPDDGSLYGQLVYFSSRQLPRFIEMLGKTRALSVHVSALGRSDKEFDLKLSYLLQCIEQDKPAVFETSSLLQQQLIHDLPCLLTVKTYEYKLDFLLEKVSKEIVGKKKVKIPADEMFAMVTDIIDVYWRIVEDSLQLIHRWHREDLENWMMNG